MVVCCPKCNIPLQALSANHNPTAGFCPVCKETYSVISKPRFDNRPKLYKSKCDWVAHGVAISGNARADENGVIENIDLHSVSLTDSPAYPGARIKAPHEEKGILKSLVEEHPELKDMTLAEADALHYFGICPECFRNRNKDRPEAIKEHSKP
jgi:uncharacterized protein YbaR (Trm112 family)